MTPPNPTSTERRAKLLYTAAKAAKNFASILDFDEILTDTVDIICDEFGFYYAGVFLIDASGKYAVLQAGRGAAGQAMVAEGHKLEIGGNSMIGEATGKRAARISLDVGEEKVFFKNPHLPKTRSEMGLPLIVGDELIGALTVQSEEEAAFSDEDITTLQTMADQLAVAIQNARLHQQMTRRAKYLEAANIVSKNLASILDLEELLPKTVDVICEAYGFYYAGVFLLGESGEYAVLRAGRGAAGEAMIAAGHKLEVGGNSMIGEATKKRAARISLDVGEEAVFFKNPHLPETHSEMALPLIVGDQVLGAVTVQSEKQAAFSQEDIDTLQTMADHLAVAIRNAYSLQELERAHEELLRKKTYEALATATTQAIHWIGNKALPITTTVVRMEDEIKSGDINIPSLLEDLEMIDTSAQMIVKVKEHLLGPAREHQPRPVMIADIAYSTCPHAGIPAKAFKLEAPDTPLYVLGDSTQLGRVFYNLYKNSLEANASQITVSVELSEDGRHVQVQVADNGDGMPQDMLGKVWASFFTTKGPAHNGLGLAACLHVITQHEGNISVASTPGKGTVFTITLQAVTAPSQTEIQGGAADILLIDDQDAWATFAQRALEAAGKTVKRQTDAANAEEYELVLLDDGLQSGSVLETLQVLYGMGQGKHTIVISAAPTVERTTAYMNAGARDVILKPYSEAELAALIR